MAEEYGLLEKQPKTEFPERELLRVPHNGKVLTVGFPAFGPNYFSGNVAKMAEFYSHPRTGERISLHTWRGYFGIYAERGIAIPQIYKC